MSDKIKEEVFYRESLALAGIEIVPGPIHDVDKFHPEILFLLKPIACLPISFKATVSFLFLC
jgi:hypothetical protein